MPVVVSALFRNQSCKFQTKLKISPFFVSSAIAKSNWNS